MRSFRRWRAADDGFTVLEVIVALAVLSVIMVPLTTTLVQAFRQSSEVDDRLSQSGDAQRIGAAWTRDVQSLDSEGNGNLGLCENPNAVGATVTTFYWDRGTNMEGSGQPTLVPRSATWAITGTSTGMRLVRWTCVDGVFEGERVLASRIGVAGKTPSQVVYGYNGPGAGAFCRTKTCLIQVAGSFSYQSEATRRVPGKVATSETLGSPTITGGSSRNTGVTVGWTPPVPDTGLTGYELVAWTSETGGIAGSTEIDASGNAGDVLGLQNGTPYWVVVYAKSAQGLSDPSNVWGPIIPANTPPTLVQDVQATAGPVGTPGSIVVTWSPPDDDGGLPIDEYVISVTSTNTSAPAVADISVSGSTLSKTVTGLQLGTNYGFALHAVNAIGAGPIGDFAYGITRPPKPTDVTAAAGPKSAIVGFTISGNGEIPLAATGAVRVTATCTVPSASCTDRVFILNHPDPFNPNTSVSGLDTHSAVPTTDLVNGQTYSVTVEVKNTSADANAWSPPSDPVTVKPIDVPPPPTAVVSIANTGSSRELQFSLAAGAADNGEPITSYLVTESSGRTRSIPAGVNGAASDVWNGGGSIPSALFTDFVDYHFTVRACNPACGAPTGDLVAAPGIPPVAPTVGAVRSGPRQVTMTSALNPLASGYVGTKWEFECPGNTASAQGTNPTAVISNVTVGTVTCKGHPYNLLKAVLAGNATSVALIGAEQSAQVTVYDAPGPLVAVPTVPSTGIVNNLSVTAATLPVPDGGIGPLTYAATCGSVTVSNQTTLPIAITGLTPASTVNCTLTATNGAGYSTTSAPVSIKLTRTTPVITQLAGTKAITVQDGSQGSNANQFRVLLQVKHDPGVTTTAVRFNLNGTTTSATASPAGSGIITQALRKTEVSGEDRIDYLWVTIKPPDGDWLGFKANNNAAPRVRQFTAAFSATVGPDQTANNTIGYWAVPEWDSGSQDFPAVYQTSGTTDGNSSAGASYSVSYRCDDNDGGGADGTDGQCDNARLRLRLLDDATDATVIGLVCTSSMACENATGNNNHVVGNFNADDNTTRTFNFTLPSSIAKGQWVIEGGFCNRNGFCPSGAPAGYGERPGAGQGDPVGGTDWMMLGSLYIP